MNAGRWLQAALLTPVFVACLFVAMAQDNFAKAMLWLIYGFMGVQLRLIVSTAVYWDYTRLNLERATGYLQQLRTHYLVERKQLDEVFPSIAESLAPETDITFAIATPASHSVGPIKTFYRFAFPGFREGLVISSDPRRAGTLQRFSMLHEVGHALFFGVAHSLNRHAPGSVVFVIYWPVAMLFDAWPYQVMVIACSLWHWYLEQRADYPEVSADRFALEWLRKIASSEEAEFVRSHLIKKFSEAGVRASNEDRSRLAGLRDPVSAPDIEPFHPGGNVLGKAEAMRDLVQGAMEQRVRSGPVLICLLLAMIAAFYPEQLHTRPIPEAGILISIAFVPALIMVYVKMKAAARAYWVYEASLIGYD